MTKRELQEHRAHQGPGVTASLARPFIVDGGLAVNVHIPADALAALADPDRAAFAFVAEDGVPLPQGDALHADIRAHAGMYSVWGDQVYWSSSDGSDCNTNDREYTLVVPQAEARTGTFALDRPFGSRGALAAVSRVPAPAVVAMRADPLVRACSVVLEDGVPLPHPNAQHQAISDQGAGRYSIWDTSVYFSATDGSDPQHNGKAYEIVVPDPAMAQAMVQSYAALLVEDDARLLGLMRESGLVNNTFVNNFIMQCDGALAWLDRHGKARGRAAVLGCGHKPWAPLRLLAAGFDEVIANDLFPVLETFPTAAIDDTILLLRPLRPDLADRLQDLRSDHDGKTQLRGLVPRGECAFEHMGLEPNSIDFVYSNSVLEHVMDAEGVYEAMARYLRPGGLGYHGIDLRDHLHYFDPLRFLTMTAEEYTEINTENRLRASDHIRMARNTGLDVEVLRLRVLTPEGGLRSSTGEPPTVIADSWESVIPAVDAETIASLDSAFADYEPADLSVVGIDLAIRRAATRLPTSLHQEKA